MPVTKPPRMRLTRGRVETAPAQCKRYNIPDYELKGLGLRVEPSRKDGGGKDGAACHNCGCGGAGRAHAYFRG